MTGPEAFGLELRRARERRGLTLEQVSERTKVSVGHFAGLERGEISRWPAGIFGRAFVRGYAGAVGLDPEELVAAFARIYPESPDGRRVAPKPDRSQKAVEPAGLPETPADSEPESAVFRLVLDSAAPAPAPSRLESAALRVAAALIDVLLPLTVAGAAAFVAGREWFWITAVCVGVAGHVTVFGLTGSTPGLWLSRYRRGTAGGVLLASQSRRRTDAEVGLAARRHVPRHPSSRPSPHAHRLRH
jgi:transcriptional regulator with XRE-family HTH domain